MRNKNQNLKAQNKAGFTPCHLLDPKSDKGFTLIELLVVVSLIALLSSIALIAFQSARGKSRDAKRLADMTQMNTGLELFFAENHGYPTSSGGIPASIAPNFTAVVPQAPQSNDGACAGQFYPSPPAPSSYSAMNYYYYPTGPSYLAPDNINTVYSDYGYYFCLGADTANFSAGIHVLTPEGVH